MAIDSEFNDGVTELAPTAADVVPETEQGTVSAIAAGVKEQASSLNLPPEVIEEVMEKVQDIDAKGTAFTTVISMRTPNCSYIPNETRPQARQNALMTILRAGIFGGEFRDGTKMPTTPSEYREHLKRRRTNAYFNIIGRMAEFFSPNQKIRNSNWFYSGGISIIFSLDGYEEVPPYDYYTSPEPRTFKCYDEYSTIPFQHNRNLKLGSKDLARKATHRGGGLYNEDGYPNANSDHGFVLSPRIPPKRFRGIVFKADEGQTSDYLKDFKNKTPWRPSTPEELQERADEIVAVMLEEYKDKPDRLIPVYDADGNLYWPKKMTSEEVKRFVEDRRK